MRKILSVLAAVGLTSTAASAVVACGNKTNSEVTKINLDSLDRSNIQGVENMRSTQALDAFVSKNHEKYSDLGTNLEIVTFTPPSYITPGELVVKAKTNSRYTGTITVQITQLGRTDLRTLGLNADVTIVQDGDQNDAFKAFLETNQAILGSDLTSDEVDLSAFKGPSIAEDGTLTITVKPEVDNKYTGTITIGVEFFLDENNVSDVLHYLSDHKLLNFNVPTGFDRGASGSGLLSLIIDLFRASMSGLYQYGPNVEGIGLYTYSQAPNQEQINTKGFVWTPTGGTMNVQVAFSFKDGSYLRVPVTDLFVTVTMV